MASRKRKARSLSDDVEEERCSPSVSLDASSGDTEDSEAVVSSPITDELKYIVSGLKDTIHSRRKLQELQRCLWSAVRWLNALSASHATDQLQTDACRGLVRALCQIAVDCITKVSGLSADNSNAVSLHWASALLVHSLLAAHSTQKLLSLDSDSITKLIYASLKLAQPSAFRITVAKLTASKSKSCEYSSLSTVPLAFSSTTATKTKKRKRYRYGSSKRERSVDTIASASVGVLRLLNECIAKSTVLKSASECTQLLAVPMVVMDSIYTTLLLDDAESDSAVADSGVWQQLSDSQAFAIVCGFVQYVDCCVQNCSRYAQTTFPFLSLHSCLSILTSHLVDTCNAVQLASATTQSGHLTAKMSDVSIAEDSKETDKSDAAKKPLSTVSKKTDAAIIVKRSQTQNCLLKCLESASAIIRLAAAHLHMSAGTEQSSADGVSTIWEVLRVALGTLATITKEHTVNLREETIGSVLKLLAAFSKYDTDLSADKCEQSISLLLVAVVIFCMQRSKEFRRQMERKTCDGLPVCVFFVKHYLTVKHVLALESTKGTVDVAKLGHLKMVEFQVSLLLALLCQMGPASDQIDRAFTLLTKGRETACYLRIAASLKEFGQVSDEITTRKSASFRTAQAIIQMAIKLCFKRHALKKRANAKC